MSQENRGEYYPALVLESPTTPTQRARNYALYLALRDGTPVEQRTGTRDGVGLNAFTFEVPLKSCSHGTDNGQPTVSFRLDKSGECYRRLLSYISDHFPNGCDADDEVKKLRSALAAAVCMLEDAVQFRDDIDEWFADIDRRLRPHIKGVRCPLCAEHPSQPSRGNNPGNTSQTAKDKEP